MEVIREIKIWQQQVKWNCLQEDGVSVLRQGDLFVCQRSTRRMWPLRAAAELLHYELCTFEEAKYDLPNDKPMLSYACIVCSPKRFSSVWLYVDIFSWYRLCTSSSLRGANCWGSIREKLFFLLVQLLLLFSVVDIKSLKI